MTRKSTDARRPAISMAATAITIVVAVAVVVATAVYLTESAQSTSTSSSSSFSASSSSSSESISAASGSTISVSIPKGSGNPNNAPGYAPDSITVVIGVNNTVTWTNEDTVAHTVTSTSAPSSGSFDSGNLPPGQSWIHTFAVAGTYQYDCSYHAWMKGTIVVKAGA